MATKDIWETMGMPRHGSGAMWQRTVDAGKNFLLRGGAPGRTDLAITGGAVFLLAALLLAAMRPPMVVATPRSEYEVPGISPTAVLSWAILAAVGGVVVRWYWN